MNLVAKNTWILHPTSGHPNKNTFETPWYKSPIRTKDVPIFTGFFRVGNHYLIELIQRYFEANVWIDGRLKPENIICFWTHDHDHCLEAITPCMFLYRKNVCHMMYSLYKSQYVEAKACDVNVENFIKYRVNDYKYNTNKWLRNADLIIEYEKLVYKPQEEFKKIAQFFGKLFVQEKFERVKKVITHDYVIGKWKNTLPNYFFHRDANYVPDRNKWIEKFKPTIFKHFFDETHTPVGNLAEFLTLE